MVSTTIQRIRTANALKHTRAQLGDLHPATWAAYGRALVAWGADRIRSIAPPLPPEADRRLVRIAALAGARLSRPGFANRRARRARVRRCGADGSVTTVFQLAS